MDLVRVTLAYHTDAPFHPLCADLNADAVVDVSDVAAVAGAYDAACPAAWRAGAPEALAALPGDARRRLDVVDAAHGRTAPRSASSGKGAGAYAVYRGGGRPVAWAIQIARRGGGSAFTAPVFDVSPDDWVVENAVRDGQARLAAAHVGGALTDGAVLGWLPDHAPDDIVLTGYQLAGRGGSRVTGTVMLERTAACGSCVYVPSVRASR
jgi:hypothetical protein